MWAELPPRYAHLARRVATAEIVLGSNGPASAIDLNTANDLAQDALEAWLQEQDEATNQLRVRANIIRGLAHAYAGSPWQWTVQASSICVDLFRSEPDTTSSDTLRLYALGSVNNVVVRLLDNSESLPVATEGQIHIALEYFDKVDPEGLYHWKGVAHLASAFLGARDGRPNANQIAEHARLALTHLDIGSELCHLARHLQGRGNGRIPGSGWFGTGFFARRAKFTIHDLYHFSPYPS